MEGGKRKPMQWDANTSPPIGGQSLGDNKTAFMANMKGLARAGAALNLEGIEQNRTKEFRQGSKNSQPAATKIARQQGKKSQQPPRMGKRELLNCR